MSELVTGAAVIRAYGVRAPHDRRVKRAIDRQRDACIRAGRLGAFLFPSGELFAVLTIAAVVVAGVASGPRSGSRPARWSASSSSCYRFLEPVAEFTEILDQTQTAVAGWRGARRPRRAHRRHRAGRRPATLPRGRAGHRARPRDVPLPAPAGAGAEDACPRCVDVTFTIEPGTSVAVVGATGSGKTTLAKLLTRLADPTTGAVRVAGIDLRDVGIGLAAVARW